MRSILDKSFIYIPAARTSVAETFKRFGWLPQSERKAKTEKVVTPIKQRRRDERT